MNRSDWWRFKATQGQVVDPDTQKNHIPLSLGVKIATSSLLRTGEKGGGKSDLQSYDHRIEAAGHVKL